MNSQPQNKPAAAEAVAVAARQTCPECGSSDTVSFPTMYEIGKSFSRSKIGSVAITGGAGFYLGGANVRLTPESQLAARVDPPKGPHISWGTISLSVMFFFTAGFFLTISERASVLVAILIGLAGFPVGYLIQHWAYRRDQAVYETELAAWRLKFICRQCGHTFLPARN